MGAFASDPAVLVASSGKVHLGILGQSGELWNSVCGEQPCDNVGKFGVFDRVFGNPPPGSASAPSIVAWGDDRIDVFVLGRDRAIWQQTWDKTYWLGWQSLGGILVSAPVATSWGSGRLDVFATGPSGVVFHLYCQKLGVPGCRGTGWSSWLAELGAPPGGAKGDPRAVAGSGELIDVVVLGGDGNVYHQSWERGWTGWQKVEGKFGFSPTVTRSGSQLELFGVDRHGKVWTAGHKGRRFKGFEETTLSAGSSVVAFPGRGGTNLIYRDPAGTSLRLAVCQKRNCSPAE